MALLEEILAGSERAYRWLVKIYPKEFRAEHESEMVQHFRDLCREQLGHLSSMRMMGLWGHVFLDLAASAAIEHLRRKKPMNTLDQDLRWDVRYGVQMFCKHFLWLLKYTSLALIGGALAIVLAAWIWSGVRIWQKEKAVQQAWVEMTGKTPEGYFQTILQQFPKTGMNETARQLEELTTRLGIFNPMPNRLYDGQRRNAIGPFDTVDVPIHVLSQLRKPNDDFDEAPAKLQEYLRKHQSDLEALYGLFQRNDVPRWEIDLSQLMHAPVPNHFYHRQLQGLIALDILDKTRQGDAQAALQALDASWKINQSLRERPDFMSQMIAASILGMQTAVIRKLESVPANWQQRLGVKAWQDSFLRCLEFDAVVLSRNATDGLYPMDFRWWNPLRGPLAAPLRRVARMERLEMSEEVLSVLRRSDFCDRSPDGVVDQSVAQRTTWNFGVITGVTNYSRCWRMLMETAAQMELTRKVLEVKSARKSAENSAWSRRLGEMDSSLCLSAKWVHEVEPDGTIKIKCLNLPAWLTKEHPQSVSLIYSLIAKS